VTNATSLFNEIDETFFMFAFRTIETPARRPRPVFYRQFVAIP
jgi:hypothetical protein